MDSRFVLGCAMLMNLVQFQSKLSVPKIFQQFGIETAGTVIVDRALRVQDFGCSYYGEIASRLVFDIFQCLSCRLLLILSALFKSVKLSLHIGFLISQAMASGASLILKRQLGQLSQSMLLAFKFMRTMAECQAFFCSVRVEDICSGDELRSGGRDRGSENKMCFETLMSLSNQEYPLHLTLTLVPFIVDESINNLKSGYLKVSNDLSCSDEVSQRRAVNIDRRQLKYLEHFVSIKTIAGDRQNQSWPYLSCLCFQQYALRYFAFPPNVCVGASITINFANAQLFVEDIIINSRTDAWLCSSEAFN